MGEGPFKINSTANASRPVSGGRDRCSAMSIEQRLQPLYPAVAQPVPRPSSNRRTGLANNNAAKNDRHSSDPIVCQSPVAVNAIHASANRRALRPALSIARAMPPATANPRQIDPQCRSMRRTGPDQREHRAAPQGPSPEPSPNSALHIPRE